MYRAARTHFSLFVVFLSNILYAETKKNYNDLFNAIADMHNINNTHVFGVENLREKNLLSKKKFVLQGDNLF